MIEYKTGDILAEQAEALVNTVNCVGVMGRGIALQFKRAFPDNFIAYAALCKKEGMSPGRMFVFKTNRTDLPHYIINFPTKRHWKGKSRIEDIETGLEALIGEIQKYNIHSIAIPALGCGLGGLSWEEVRSRMEGSLGLLEDVTVTIFQPASISSDSHTNRPEIPPVMTPGRAALIQLMDRYTRVLLDPFVTLLEVHKLLYFMQVAGEPMNLRFTKSHYGPYAENLRHVLNVIEGHFLSGYYDGADTPDKPLKLFPEAIDNAYTVLQNKTDTKIRFEKVADLVEGFESSFGLELLSTVHWVISEQNAQVLPEIIRETYAWNERKKQFSKRQIQIAFETLTDKGWILSKPA